MNVLIISFLTMLSVLVYKTLDYYYITYIHQSNCNIESKNSELSSATNKKTRIS